MTHIIELCLVSGFWEKASLLAADITERTQNYDNNELRIKALSYHGLSMLWLGIPLQANLIFQEAGFHIGMLQVHNDMTPLIAYARLADALELDNSSFTHDLLDSGGQTSVERQYHHALCKIHNVKPKERIPVVFPWQDALNKVDYIQALHPHSPEKSVEELDTFWSQLPQHQFDGIEVVIANLGYKWTNSQIWKERLKNAIDRCSQKQPSKLQLSSHWLS
jgi:hypothetical protein